MSETKINPNMFFSFKGLWEQKDESGGHISQSTLRKVERVVPWTHLWSMEKISSKSNESKYIVYIIRHPSRNKPPAKYYVEKEVYGNIKSKLEHVDFSIPIRTIIEESSSDLRTDKEPELKEYAPISSLDLGGGEK